MEPPLTPARSIVGGPMLNRIFQAAGQTKSNICMADIFYKTPLFLAVVCYRAGIAKYLLDHGANPNIFNSNGLSPLHQATVSDFCGTPLHCAATKGHDDIMKILLDHNAYVMTPLIAAIDAASRNCMVLLIEAGADRMGALTYAMENIHSEELVSTDFVNYIMEDVPANRFVPDEDEPESKRKVKAEGFKKLADCSFKQEDYLSAAKSYTVAIRFDPNNATLYSNRSLCRLRMGEGDKALLDANKCRKLRPDWPKACYRQGAALMLLKDYKGAREHFSDGLKLDPANTEMEDALRKAHDAMKDVSQPQGRATVRVLQGVLQVGQLSECL
ncbi:hypothetical protein VPH35_003411 [Triticum aestivum]